MVCVNNLNLRAYDVEKEITYPKVLCLFIKLIKLIV